MEFGKLSLRRYAFFAWKAFWQQLSVRTLPNPPRRKSEIFYNGSWRDSLMRFGTL
jgi:hypothetical protein